MDWTQVIIAGLGCSALTVLIQKIYGKKEDKAKAQSVEIGNGMSAMEFYNAIENAVKIRVEQETKPLVEQLVAYKDKCEKLEARVALLEEEIKKQGCYQPVCDSRLAKGQADILA